MGGGGTTVISAAKDAAATGAQAAAIAKQNAEVKKQNAQTRAENARRRREAEVAAKASRGRQQVNNEDAAREVQRADLNTSGTGGRRSGRPGRRLGRALTAFYDERGGKATLGG